MAVKTSWLERVRAVDRTGIAENVGHTAPHQGAPGTLVIDGVTISSAAPFDHVLLTNQQTPKLNGPWISQGANADMIRPDDFGAVTAPTGACIVTAGPEGTSLARSQWRLITTEPFTVGVDPLTFAREDAVANVKLFGAKGDGVTDDTAAIQAAINFVGGSGGGIVVFPTPAAKYRTTSTLSIAYHNIIIEGNNSQINFESRTGCAFDGANMGVDYPDSTVIQDLVINLTAPSVYSVTSASASGGAITVTVPLTIGLTSGMTVLVAGLWAAANGLRVISNVTTTTFQIAGAFTGSATSGSISVPVSTGATCTGAAPIRVTVANAQGLANNNTVNIMGMTAAAANGTWLIANLVGNSFDLVNSDGSISGAGTGGIVTPVAVAFSLRFSHGRFRGLSATTYPSAASVFAPGQTAFLLPGNAAGKGPYINTFVDCSAQGHGAPALISGANAPPVSITGISGGGLYSVIIKIISVVSSTVTYSWSSDGGASAGGTNTVTTYPTTQALGSTGLSVTFPDPALTPGSSYASGQTWVFSSGQSGWYFTAAGTRAANGNRFVGGRLSAFENAWTITGAGNSLYGPVVEGSSAQAFVVNHPTTPAASASTAIYSAYVEVAGVRAFNINNATDTLVTDPYVTGAGGPTTFFLDTGVHTVLLWNGDLRIANSSFLKARNAANSDDIKLIYVDGADEIGIGGTTVANVEIGAKAGASGGYVGALLNGTQAWSFGANAGGDNIMYLLNALTAPTSNPTGGSVVTVRPGTSGGTSPRAASCGSQDAGRDKRKRERASRSGATAVA